MHNLSPKLLRAQHPLPRLRHLLPQLQLRPHHAPPPHAALPPQLVLRPQPPLLLPHALRRREPRPRAVLLRAALPPRPRPLHLRAQQPRPLLPKTGALQRSTRLFHVLQRAARLPSTHAVAAAAAAGAPPAAASARAGGSRTRRQDARGGGRSSSRVGGAARVQLAAADAAASAASAAQGGGRRLRAWAGVVVAKGAGEGGGVIARFGGRGRRGSGGGVGARVVVVGELGCGAHHFEGGGGDASPFWDATTICPPVSAVIVLSAAVLRGCGARNRLGGGGAQAKMQRVAHVCVAYVWQRERGMRNRHNQSVFFGNIILE